MRYSFMDPQLRSVFLFKYQSLKRPQHLILGIGQFSAMKILVSILLFLFSSLVMYMCNAQVL
jgi:hypothetical protein